jgi:hypothetical protein
VLVHTIRHWDSGFFFFLAGRSLSIPWWRRHTKLVFSNAWIRESVICIFFESLRPWPNSQLRCSAEEHCSARGLRESRQARMNGLPGGAVAVPFETKLSNSWIREVVIHRRCFPRRRSGHNVAVPFESYAIQFLHTGHFLILARTTDLVNNFGGISNDS